MAEEAESETTPEVLADFISLTGAVIPAAVIATWTQRERDEALTWAAAEHLSASDNPVTRVPMPGIVKQARDIAGNRAMAQLAVEAWARRKQQLESYRELDGWDDMIATVQAAQGAITGLLTLLGPDGRTGWQSRALEVIGRYPGGVQAVDLTAMLGRHGPAREELDAWLAAGQARGALECSPVAGTWRLADPDMSGAVRRARPAKGARS